jgi:hypothetical protein
MALMENTDALAQHQRDLTNATGSAKKMFDEAYSGSLDSKINDLKRNFESLYETMLNSTELNDFISIISGSVGTIANFSNAFGFIPTVIATAVTALSLFNTKFKESFIMNLPVIKQLNNAFETLKLAIKGESIVVETNTISQEKNNIVHKENALNVMQEAQVGKMGASTKTLDTTVTTANTGAKIANTIATGAMTVAVTALQAVMTFGLSLAITSAIGGIMSLGKSLLGTGKQMKDCASQVNELKTSLDGMDSEKQMTVTFVENSNELKNTKEGTEKQKEIQDKIAETKQKLIDLDTDYGTILNNENLTLEEQKDQMDAIYEKKLRQKAQDLDKSDSTKSQRDAEKTKKQLEKDIDTYNQINNAIKTINETGKTATVDNMIFGKNEIDGKNGLIDRLDKIKTKIKDGTIEIKDYNSMVDMMKEANYNTSRSVVGLSEDQDNLYKSLIKTKNETGDISESIKTVVDTSPESEINLLSGALTELTEKGDLSSVSVKRLAEILPKLDLSNMSTKEKVDALTKALKDQKDIMDKNSLNSAKQGQKDFVSQAEQIEKINGYLKSMGENGQMSLDVMKALATDDEFAGFTGDLTNLTEVQSYFNSKLNDMKVIQGQAYSQMMGNSSQYYQQQLNNGDNLQNAFNQWASNFVNTNGEGYNFDARNFNTLNEAKVGMINQVAGKMGEFLAGFVGGSADAYAQELRNCTDWATMKTKILEKLQEQIDKVQQALADTESRANQINASTSNGDLNNAQAERMYRIEQDRLANLNNAKQKIDTSFDEFNRTFSGYTPQGLGSSYSGSSGNNSGKNKDSEKQVADLESLVDRYYRLKNVIDLVTSTIGKYETAMKNVHGTEYVNYIYKEIDAYKQKQQAIKDNISEMEKERWELRVKLDSSGFGFDNNWNLDNNYTNRLEQLRNQANGLTGDAKENAIKRVKDLSETTKRYAELCFTDIPKAEQEWQDLSNSIQEANQKMIDAVAEQEKKTYDIIKYYAEKTTKTKQDEIDKQIEQINKLYSDGDKQADLNSKQKQLAELKSEMDKFEFATDKLGQSKFKQLQDQYKQLQEEMNKTIRDNQKDTTIDSMNKEKDALGKALENYLKPENINTIIENGLKTGMINIMGQVVDLKNANAQMLKESEIGYTNVNNQIKQYKDNLSSIIAMMPQLSNIASNLGFNIDRSISTGVNPIGLDTSKFITNTTNGINISMPLTINGSVGDNNLSSIQSMIDTAIGKVKSELNKRLSYK